MDLLLLLKLVHVAAALVWVGGLATLSLLVVLTDRKGDDAATLGALALLGLAGRIAFSRVAPLTLGTGLLLAWLAGWGLAPWVVLSATLALAGHLYLKRVVFPGGAAVAARRAGGDVAGAAVLARRQLRRLGADLAIKFAIVAVMVLKPGLGDPFLLVPAAILALGAALHLRTPDALRAPQPA